MVGNVQNYPIRHHHRLGPTRSTALVVGAAATAALIASATSAATRRRTGRATHQANEAPAARDVAETQSAGVGRVPLSGIAKRPRSGALPTPAAWATGLVAAVATVAWLRRPAGGKRRPLSFAVVDTETTGLDDAVERVIEVAVVHADGLGRLTDSFNWRVRPDDGRHGAEHVHHISEADLADAPSFGQVADRLAAALRGRTLVAHNAPFDTRFLLREYRRAGNTPPGALARPLCTLELASCLGMSPLRLSEVARSLGTPQPATAHRALDDAVATAQLLTPLLNRAGIARANELPLVDGTKPRPARPRRRSLRFRRFLRRPLASREPSRRL